ncbi:MAG: hypothetical protein AAGB15_11365, partial [Pseudomonadota bacterium]
GIRNALIDALAAPCDVAEAIAQATGLNPLAVLTQVPQARAHPNAMAGGEPDQVALVLREAIQRHQALLSHASEIGDARRDLADADDESWCVRVDQANREREAADNRALAEQSETAAESTESVFQRMLDNGTWRRARG